MQHKLTLERVTIINSLAEQTFIVLVTFKSLLQFLSLLGRQRKPLQQAVNCLPRISHEMKRGNRLSGLRRVLLHDTHVTIGFLPVNTDTITTWLISLHPSTHLLKHILK